MRLFRSLCIALLLSAPLAGLSQPRSFEINKLADGVYAVIRNDSPGLAANANNVIVINDKDVVVVDTNLAPSFTKEVLAEIRKLTNKPVRYVINTHWHDDHISGNQVYRDAYPGVEFIAHADMPGYMKDKGFENRRKTLESLSGFIDFVRGLLKSRKTSGGRELSEEEVAGLSNDAELGERFLREGPTTEIILPTKTVSDKLVLQRGKRRIEILHLGRGHTSGDLVVHLPKEKILITGDLVVYPVPYVGGEQSYVTEWATTLEKIIALRPAMIVPGHGKVLRDDAYLRLIASLFKSVTEQTRAGVARGETLDEIQKTVNIDELRKQITGDSFYRSTLFRNYVAAPSVAAAYRELTATSK